MSRKNKRRANSTVGKCATDNIQGISRETYVEMQAEAYYRALKRLDEEKAERSREEAQSVVKKKWYVKMKEFLIIVFLPLIATKRLKEKKSLYNSILSLCVTIALEGIGSILWIFGISGIFVCAKKFVYEIGLGMLTICGNLLCVALFFVVMIMGAFFFVSGDSFSNETDNYKIWSFSASCLALVGCIISVVALIIEIVR